MVALNIVLFIFASLFLLAFYVTILIVGAAAVRQFQKLTTKKLMTVGQIKKMFLYTVPILLSLCILIFFIVSGDYTGAATAFISSACIIYMLKHIGLNTTVIDFPVKKLFGVNHPFSAEFILKISDVFSIAGKFGIIDSCQENNGSFYYSKKYLYHIDEISPDGNFELRTE